MPGGGFLEAVAAEHNVLDGTLMPFSVAGIAKSPVLPLPCREHDIHFTVTSAKHLWSAEPRR